MNRQLRLTRLLELVTAQGFVTIDDLVDSLEVSAATARRDVEYLANQQLLTRTRGGAMANATSGEIPLGMKATKRSREKKAIAAAVAAQVKPGQVIALNGGTTATACAYEIGIATAAEEAFTRTPLTVVTNAVNIANDLVVRPGVRLVVIGGVARAQSYELIGPLAEPMLRNIDIDTFYIGADAVDPQRGLYTHNDGEAAINSRLVQAARHTVAITDSSKFTTSAFAHICNISHLAALITDNGISDEQLAALQERTEVLLVDPAANNS
ncbi:DeoR/GlpR family DNA-binding transcription regulator [Corynebacterium choanae]|uniref:Glycerol-3-phosphate regulon repressor n=1 Tax=Corynebacterium choanae TaxID=1862358 RepID=A0A3G6J3K4_9CORY|nr:DeoR/GlpR family DNA-binding transcription regulator [Corynebacterium choanae]AZA12597.1 Glycerol-3-phosphate regulon repressor [Corynebacterium choanae]